MSDEKKRDADQMAEREVGLVVGATRLEGMFCQRLCLYRC